MVIGMRYIMAHMKRSRFGLTAHVGTADVKSKIECMYFPPRIVNRGDSSVWVYSKDLCSADDGDIVRQKKPNLGRLTSGNLHWLTPGREACDSGPPSARLLPTMSRGHLPNDRDPVAGSGLFL